MEKFEVAMLFKRIKRQYPGFDSSREAIDEWHEDYLRDIPYEEGLRNVIQHIKTSKYYPTPAEIRGTVNAPVERHIPGVAETKRMLDSLRSIEPTGPTPEQRERVRRLARTD